MLGALQALKIGEGVICWIAIFVMDMAVLRNSAKRNSPGHSMQCLAATRVIAVSRPNTIKPAIEILRENVQHDRISVPLVRDSADFHPNTVLNI